VQFCVHLQSNHLNKIKFGLLMAAELVLHMRAGADRLQVQGPAGEELPGILTRQKQNCI
jgi:hypothetical protein